MTCFSSFTTQYSIITAILVLVFNICLQISYLVIFVAFVLNFYWVLSFYYGGCLIFLTFYLYWDFVCVSEFD
jgi:hypothetical protein